MGQPILPAAHEFEGVLPGGGRMRQVEGQVIVVEVGRIPARAVGLEVAAAGRPPGVHVLDRDGHPAAGGQLTNALDETGRVAALPAERRMHHDHVGAQLVGGLGGALQLHPRVAAPHPLGDQQARGVDRQHRNLVVVAEPFDGVHVGGQRIDADHHLDPVVAEQAGHLETDRDVLRVDRGRRQGDLHLGPGAVHTGHHRRRREPAPAPGAGIVDRSKFHHRDVLMTSRCVGVRRFRVSGMSW